MNDFTKAVFLGMTRKEIIMHAKMMAPHFFTPDEIAEEIGAWTAEERGSFLDDVVVQLQAFDPLPPAKTVKENE
jgi:hypothetical protein